MKSKRFKKSIITMILFILTLSIINNTAYAKTVGKWGEEDREYKAHLKHLREKIGPDLETPEVIFDVKIEEPGEEPRTVRRDFTRDPKVDGYKSSLFKGKGKW